MRIERRLLSRVEGVAELELFWKNGQVNDAKVRIPTSRGIEKVLEGRPFMDALVITPRVCGICGHAHLMACVRAIEDVIGKVKLSRKSKLLRDVTLLMEIVNNHIKWFYLFVMPDFLRLGGGLSEFEPFSGEKWKKAINVSSELLKIVALFGGQWPHSSYAVPGGITSNPTHSDLSKALLILDRAFLFFLEDMVGMREDDFQNIRNAGLWEDIKGDLGVFIELSIKYRMEKVGMSYNRFITGGEIFPCVSQGHFTGEKKLCFFNLSKIKECHESSYSAAKAVRYGGLPYETGPLPRQFLSGNPFIRRMHKSFKDSYVTRVVSRVLEVWEMLVTVKDKLISLYTFIDEPSFYTSYKRIEGVSGSGVGIAEAARGTLIHRVWIEKGTIVRYRIITPSVWNLGPRCERFLGVAEKAMVGLENPVQAEMVLRSFDVCSVCTTR
ncbi:MAG: nickel-dependent hydrogenase large subunit [Aquificaceae bacterium]